MKKPASENIGRYMRGTLMAGETCIREGRFHGFYTFSALIVFAFCTLAGWGVNQAYYRLFGLWDIRPIYAGLGIGCWLFFWMMLKKWTTEILLTDKRLIYKRGFFSIDVDAVDIEQLISDNIHQSFLGRLLDFGALHISCLIAHDLWLPAIRHPYAFRNALEQQKLAHREHAAKEGLIVPGYQASRGHGPAGQA